MDRKSHTAAFHLLLWVLIAANPSLRRLRIEFNRSLAFPCCLDLRVWWFSHFSPQKFFAVLCYDRICHPVLAVRIILLSFCGAGVRSLLFHCRLFLWFYHRGRGVTTRDGWGRMSNHEGRYLVFVDYSLQHRRSLFVAQFGRRPSHWIWWMQE